MKHTKLWLWKNFAGGIPEYWAFNNAYPCRLEGGDPLVLGEPCGYAIFMESAKGRDYDDAVVLENAMRAKSTERDSEIAALTARVRELEAANKGLHESYLRIRGMLNAWDTPTAPTAEQVYQHTEGRLAAQGEELGRLRQSLETIADYDCVNAIHSVKCDGYCPPCIAATALEGG